MSRQRDISSLQELLDRLEEADKGEENVSIEQVVNKVGRRSFGAMLLVPGLIGASPLSGIPGTPTVVGIMVLLIAGQLLLGREKFWLPKFLLRRSVSRKRFCKAIRWLRPVARFVDRLIKPRLTWLTKGVAMYLIAGICLLMALAAPVLEFVPFAISGVGTAVAAFGLALIAHDGVLAVLSFLACAGTAVIVVISLT